MVVITAMTLLIALVAISMDYTTTINRHVQRTNTLETAVAVGDSCIEILFVNWRALSREKSALRPTRDFATIPLPIRSQFPALTDDSVSTPFAKRGTDPDPDSGSDYDPNYTISNFKVVAVSPEFTSLPAGTPGADSMPVPSDTASPFPMIGPVKTPVPILPSGSDNVFIYNYIASADVTLPALGNRVSGGTGKGNVVAKVRRVFQRQGASPMDFAIFYKDPLEIHPGAPFIVDGPVHTNSTLWTGHNTLTFEDRVTFGSSWAVDFMRDENGTLVDLNHAGETPTKPGYPDGMPPAHVNPFELPTISNIINANTDSDYREVIEPPVTGIIDPYKDQRYWNQASIIIEVSDNSNKKTRGWDGIKGDDFVNLYTVNPSTGVTTAITSGALFDMFQSTGAITTDQSIQDNREGVTYQIATLDVAKIVTTVKIGNPSYTYNNFGGIVYIYDKSATAGNRRAIRVQNANKIPTAGLTIASNNAVFVQGDFNTGGNGTTNNNVPSNMATNLASNGTYKDPANPPDPQVAGYTRAPAAVLADAANILSNNWQDNNSTATLSARRATATTINAAIISGIVPTNINGNGSYSGGAENFPRFLEDWSNVPVNYYGSMVELYHSQQAIGKWTMVNNYNAPARNWFYDKNFKTTRPKGSMTMGSVTYLKGRWTVQ